jgi:fructose-1,6-bisphosphatase/inositol monophosphatase family enzyme
VSIGVGYYTVSIGVVSIGVVSIGVVATGRKKKFFLGSRGKKFFFFVRGEVLLLGATEFPQETGVFACAYCGVS